MKVVTLDLDEFIELINTYKSSEPEIRYFLKDIEFSTSDIVLFIVLQFIPNRSPIIIYELRQILIAKPVHNPTDDYNTIPYKIRSILNFSDSRMKRFLYGGIKKINEFLTAIIEKTKVKNIRNGWYEL